MTGHASNQLRNVGLLGQGGAGKTSLAEAMLFCAGVTDRLGRVDQGSSILDSEPDEVKRQSSISLAPCFLTWQRHRVNLIDTPGYPNFIADARAALPVVDGALIVLGASGDFKVQTERVWRWAEELKLTRVIFINAMDHERADYELVLKKAEELYKCTLVPLTLPVGEGPEFRGVVDLLKNKALSYEGDGSGGFKEEAVPGELEGRVEEYRKKLIETVAETDDTLLEKYLEGEELSLEEVLGGLRSGTLAGSFVPVLSGSAIKNMGIQPLLDSLVSLMPAPGDRATVRGLDPRQGGEVHRAPKADEPFSALVFKTVIDPFAGKLTFFRVFSGELPSDSTLFNSSQDSRERAGQVYYIQGKGQQSTKLLTTGDIGAVAKLKATATGDTLCDEKNPIVFERIKFPEPAISFAISPKAKGDEEKLSTALSRLLEEDPSLRVSRDPQTKEMLISGLGALHVEVAVERIKRKFGVDVALKTPRVPYKETIHGTARVQGRYKKQTGGRGQYGDTWLELEPLERGAGFEFADKIVGGVIPKQYIPAVQKGILEAINSGPLAGYPVTDLKVTLYDGSFHSVDSSELAFKIAGSLGFKKGVMESNPCLLEPIMNIEVTVPEELVGDIIGDLNARRGRVMGVEAGPNSQTVKAQVPMAEVLAYDSALRSMTGGRGDFSMEFSHYEEVPRQIAERITAEAAAQKEES